MRAPTLAVLPIALLFAAVTLVACDEFPAETIDDEIDDNAPEPADPPADMIFVGGPVLTIEDGTAAAVAVAGSDIIAVGDSAEVMAHARSHTVVVDLAGGALVPGFIDGHSHMIKSAARQGLSRAEAVEMALRFGLTTIAELAMNAQDLDEFLALETAGELRLRVLAYAAYNASRPAEGGGSIYHYTWFPDNPPLVDDARLLRIGGVKVFVDGALGGDRGCYAMTDPYPESYQSDPSYSCPDPRGSLFMDAAELADVLVAAEEAGFIVGMHTVGDRGVDAALDALQEARSRTGNDSGRHQIHHNELMRDDQFERYLAMNVPYSARAYFYTCGIEPGFDHYFGDRYVWYANRYELANLGGLAFVESDFGYRTNPDDDRFYNRAVHPLVNLWGLTTHRENRQGTVCDPEPWLAEHTISIETALEMHTINAAYAHGVDHLVGSLRPGKRADLVLLSADPTAGAPDDLLDIEVLMTMVGGTVEYCAPASCARLPQGR